MWVWYAYELGRCTSNIILVNPKRFLYFIKFKRIVSWVLGKELIKVKSEVAKLLIFHSGMGHSEFNYPAAEVLPSIWWHLLKSVKDGVCMLHSEMKGSAGHIKLALAECAKVRLLSPAGTTSLPREEQLPVQEPGVNCLEKQWSAFPYAAFALGFSRPWTSSSLLLSN